MFSGFINIKCLEWGLIGIPKYQSEYPVLGTGYSLVIKENHFALILKTSHNIPYLSEELQTLPYYFIKTKARPFRNTLYVIISSIYLNTLIFLFSQFSNPRISTPGFGDYLKLMWSNNLTLRKGSIVLNRY